MGKTTLGKVTKLMVIADASGLPVSVHTDSATPHEVRLVQATLDKVVTVGRPRRIIGEHVHGSDPLMKSLLLRELDSSRRTARIIKDRRHKTGEQCAVTKEDGKLNAFLRGLINLKRQQRVGKNAPTIYWTCVPSILYKFGKNSRKNQPLIIK